MTLRRPPPALPAPQLTGTLPADKNFVLDLPKLRILDTSNNPFSGVLPPGWGKANTLEKLELL